jgi:hypothetical protein
MVVGVVDAPRMAIPRVKEHESFAYKRFEIECDGRVVCGFVRGLTWALILVIWHGSKKRNLCVEGPDLRRQPDAPLVVMVSGCRRCVSCCGDSAHQCHVDVWRTSITNDELEEVVPRRIVAAQASLNKGFQLVDSHVALPGVKLAVQFTINCLVLGIRHVVDIV